MKIEHTALNVKDPVRFAEWYVQHLGMQVVKKLDEPPHTHFLRGAPGDAMLEVYRNPAVPVPDHASMDPLALHIAFATDDVEGGRDRLLAAGATAAGEIEQLPGGDQVAMLRDPWGLAIQLAHRVTF